MKAYLLLALLALPAFASPPIADAPYVEKIDEGQPAPLDGVLMNKVAVIQVAQKITELQDENDELRKTAISPVLVVILVAAGVLVGAGAGVGITLAVKAK